MNKKFYVLFIFTIFLLLPVLASADMGPKPTMEFDFSYEISGPISILEGKQIECQDAECNESNELLEMGPQRFSCTQNTCRSLAYGYGTYHRLIIKFSDNKTRESEIFTKKYFNALYNVKVNNSDLIVEEKLFHLTKNQIPSLSLSFLITIIFEIIAALIVLYIMKISRKILISVLIANLVSLPLIWLILPIFTQNILLHEIFVVFLEVLILFVLNRRIISFKKAFVLSVIINSISFFLGNFIII